MATPILMPSVEPSMRAGRVTRWLRREGDFVEAGEPVAEIAADRTTMDVEAPQSGVLVRILAEAGEDEHTVDSAIGLIEPGPAPHLPPRAAPAPAHPEKPGRAPVSPRARRLAHAAGLDLARLDGSGPNGRIVESDVQAALAARAQDIHSPHAPILLGAAPAPALALSQTIPQVHLEADCRLDALETMRAKLNEAAREGKAAKISIVDCAVKAFALALQRAPRGNIAYAPGGFAQARHSHVALALEVEGGLAAPALPETETFSLAEIAAARAAFLTGRTASAGLRDGSSLVANFGVLGVKHAFPVIVAPWTSLLALGGAEKQVVVEDGVPDVALVMSVTLTFDRRAMDEVAGASLLTAFRNLIENPYSLLI